METSGHVFRVERKRGPVWYAKYRLGDGRQIQRKIGPAWTERGRPPAGWFTKRGAEEWLRSGLGQAGRRTLLGWCGQARQSPTPTPTTCATSSTTAGANPRCGATARRSGSPAAVGLPE